MLLPFKCINDSNVLNINNQQSPLPLDKSCITKQNKRYEPPTHVPARCTARDPYKGVFNVYITDLLDLHCGQVKNTKSALRKSWFKQCYFALHGEEKLQLLLETGH